MQTLCVAGRATGTTLSRVLRLTDKTISRHLRDLHLLQLVVRRREGQHVWYQCDPARVLAGRDDQGRDVLTLRHPSGAEVTRKVPAATNVAENPPTTQSVCVEANSPLGYLSQIAKQGNTQGKAGVDGRTDTDRD